MRAAGGARCPLTTAPGECAGRAGLAPLSGPFVRFPGAVRRLRGLRRGGSGRLPAAFVRRGRGWCDWGGGGASCQLLTRCVCPEGEGSGVGGEDEQRGVVAFQAAEPPPGAGGAVSAPREGAQPHRGGRRGEGGRGAGLGWARREEAVSSGQAITCFFFKKKTSELGDVHELRKVNLLPLPFNSTLICSYYICYIVKGL